RVEFELSARIALRFREEASSGNLAWRHRHEGDDLLISTSLGQGIAHLRRDGDHYFLTTSDAREYRAANAESLTEEVLGYPLPVVGLADWVRARPQRDGPPPKAHYDSLGRLTELRQGGWHIEYLAYQDESPVSLPSRLKLTYPGLEMRLAIGTWKALP
ncbi:MAG: lipoprotein insertase outer membrane protein LolB, partial [Betaproteobacteria bacterium]|nr:lipoprotein insertase outer membrane protein LolB [Betaproteobacteria bacterium]